MMNIETPSAEAGVAGTPWGIGTQAATERDPVFCEQLNDSSLGRNYCLRQQRDPEDEHKVLSLPPIKPRGGCQQASITH